ncbi:hypothetical protein Pmani_024703 [Petrolisthes manimaculis]|uniref:Citrate synthase n=1 Tax=Petrolisthes manimaculis TaxID=1843537 RepID=A0AAE1P9K3_9EUCA|nr:hypothetical protein Pmani_024703 [Petrolisthes manimaculis]
MALYRNAASKFISAHQKVHPLAALATRTQYSTESTDLREIMSQKIPAMQEEVKKFRKAHGVTKVGEITVDMMYGGMRDMKGLVTETSVLDPEEGIRFRGYSLPECQNVLPAAEGDILVIVYCTGDVPTKAQAKALSKERANLADLPPTWSTCSTTSPSTSTPWRTKLPTVAATIYRNLYHDGTSIGAIDPNKEWSANFTAMLGYNDPSL